MRVINRPLAFLLAVVLGVAGVILIVEVIALAVNSKPVLVHWGSWYRWAEKTRWKAGVVRFWSIVLIVIGLLVLALQLKPRRVSRMTVASDQKATDAAITRPGLSEALRRAATSVDGVSDASVAAKKRSVTVTARSAGQSGDVADPLKVPVTAAVQQRLDSLQLTTPPRLTVRMTTRSG